MPTGMKEPAGCRTMRLLHVLNEIYSCWTRSSMQACATGFASQPSELPLIAETHNSEFGIIMCSRHSLLVADL